jgi:hypothetical protein
MPAAAFGAFFVASKKRLPVGAASLIFQRLSCALTC